MDFITSDSKVTYATRKVIMWLKSLPETGDIIGQDISEIVDLVSLPRVDMLGLQKLWDVEDDRTSKCWQNVGHYSHFRAVSHFQRAIENRSIKK